jgi:ubiquinone/menaquinone biosynthesis C-methylase UbiE
VPTNSGFDPRVVRGAYDSIAAEYAATFGDDLDRLEVDRRLLNALADDTAGRGPVLDIGCGPAQVSRYLASRDVEPTGVDFAPAMLHTAREAAPGLTVVAADLRALPVRTGSVAGAVAFYVLQHLPRSELGAALREVRRALTPGGPLLVAVHAGQGESHPAPDITVSRYTAEECSSHLVAASFRVESVHGRDPLPHERPTDRLYVLARAE